ncbi:MAG: DUF3501 family protein, partial [Acidimicrobiales bacterium]|nr:DUF3501 family protein [Acidimicrobiales bacterium]
GAVQVFWSTPEADHESQLTRSDITSTVHYIAFSLAETEAEAFADSVVTLDIDHPEYRHSAVLSESFKESILSDWS